MPDVPHVYARLFFHFTTGGWKWDPYAPVDDRVDWLYRQVVRIDGLVSGVREELHDRITQVREELLSTTKSQQAMLDKLRAEHDYVRDVSTNIDAASLPLIGLGIVLTGVPDKGMHLWWIVPVVAFALYAIVKSGLRYSNERAARRAARIAPESWTGSLGPRG